MVRPWRWSSSKTWGGGAHEYLDQDWRSRYHRRTQNKMEGHPVSDPSSFEKYLGHSWDKRGGGGIWTYQTVGQSLFSDCHPGSLVLGSSPCAAWRRLGNGDFGNKIWDVRESVKVWNVGSIQTAVISTGAPIAVFLLHRVQWEAPGGVGKADNSSFLYFGEFSRSLMVW